MLQHNKIFLSSIVFLFISSIYLILFITNIFEDIEKKNLLIQANIVANSIDTDLLKKLKGDRGDISTSPYLKLNKQLYNIRENHEACKFLYIIANDDEKYFFYTDSQVIGSADYAEPGLLYNEISQDYKDAIKSNVATIVGPIADRWGTVITALVPIKDTKTKQTIATLGMDNSIDYWNQKSIIRHVLIISIISTITLLIIIILISIRKNTQLSHIKEQLKILSVTDELTQLYNRRKIDDIIKHEILQSKRYKNHFGLIMIDIDHFKNVNDTYGHQVGDSVLKEFAEILKLYVRKTDFVGRWGGEEFMIICVNIDADSISKLSEKIHKQIEQHQFSTINNLTASLGVTLLKQDEEIDTLIKKVDDALYEAKNNGRNNIVFRK